MQGDEERRLRRMGNTPQGGAIEGNAADDAFLGFRDFSFLDFHLFFPLPYSDWWTMDRVPFNLRKNRGPKVRYFF